MTSARRASELGALELLIGVVELGSVSRAAQAQGISQPSASTALTRLERRLGLQLLTRTPRGSEPTSAGRRIAAAAIAVLEASSALEQEAAELRRQRVARVRVAASYTIAEYVLPRCLKGWRRQMQIPEVRLDVHNSRKVQELVLDRSVDLGFVEGCDVRSGLRSRSIGSDELVVVVARQHPWGRRRKPLSAAELAGTRLITRELGSGTREVVEARLAPHRGEGSPPAILELGSTTSVKRAILEGSGPAVLSPLAMRAEIASGELRVVPVENLDLSRDFRAVWPAQSPPPPEVQALIVHAADAMRRLPETPMTDARR